MKGQTAIEYLMTYGWAILIILIVAGVLAYYGIFAPAGFLGPSAKGFAQVSIVSPWDVSSNTLRVQFENRVGSSITITNVSADEGSTVPVPPIACSAISLSLAAGERSTAQTLTCNGIGTLTTGSSYTIYVIITYDAGTMTDLKSTGTLSGTSS